MTLKVSLMSLHYLPGMILKQWHSVEIFQKHSHPGPEDMT